MKIEVGVLVFLAISVSDRLVAKKAAASTAVVLVRALPALRPVMKPPPPPPMPSAPPSERCNSTTQISAMAIMM